MVVVAVVVGNVCMHCVEWVQMCGWEYAPTLC